MGEPRRHPEWEDLSERDRLRLIFEKLEDLHEQGQETNDLLAKILAGEPPPPKLGAAARLVVTIKPTQGGPVSPVAVDIIDTDTGAKATASWTDQAGLPMATRPANAAPLVFGSDTPATATCATDPTNPDQGDIKEIALGGFNVTVAAPLDTSGAPLLEADGVTPIPAPAPTAANVVNSGAGSLIVAVVP